MHRAQRVLLVALVDLEAVEALVAEVLGDAGLVVEGHALLHIAAAADRWRRGGRSRFESAGRCHRRGGTPPGSCRARHGSSRPAGRRHSRGRGSGRRVRTRERRGGERSSEIQLTVFQGRGGERGAEGGPALPGWGAGGARQGLEHGPTKVPLLRPGQGGDVGEGRGGLEASPAQAARYAAPVGRRAAGFEAARSRPSGRSMRAGSAIGPAPRSAPLRSRRTSASIDRRHERSERWGVRSCRGGGATSKARSIPRQRISNGMPSPS